MQGAPEEDAVVPDDPPAEIPAGLFADSPGVPAEARTGTQGGAQGGRSRPSRDSYKVARLNNYRRTRKALGLGTFEDTLNGLADRSIALVERHLAYYDAYGAFMEKIEGRMSEEEKRECIDLFEQLQDILKEHDAVDAALVGTCNGVVQAADRVVWKGAGRP
jgi:hypothetical protein